MKKRILLYLGVLTIPLFCALDIWQAQRFYAVQADVRFLEQEQGQQLEYNKRVIAGIAVLSASDRIERIAREELKLEKKEAKDILQIHIEKKQNG